MPLPCCCACGAAPAVCRQGFPALQVRLLCTLRKASLHAKEALFSRAPVAHWLSSTCSLIKRKGGDAPILHRRRYSNNLPNSIFHPSKGCGNAYFCMLSLFPMFTACAIATATTARINIATIIFLPFFLISYPCLFDGAKVGKHHCVRKQSA